MRDNIIQSLSAFCFYTDSLRALENMREYNRIVLIRALLTPYANRPWAMTNLILVRFWKGCGFGFRYSQVYPSKFLQSLRKDRIQGNEMNRPISFGSIHPRDSSSRSGAIDEVPARNWTIPDAQRRRCDCLSEQSTRTIELGILGVYGFAERGRHCLWHADSRLSI